MIELRNNNVTKLVIMVIIWCVEVVGLGEQVD